MIKLKFNFSRNGKRPSTRPLVLPQSIHPWRDWWITLILFLSIVSVGSSFLAHLYFSYQALDALVGAIPASVPRYQEEVVTDTLENYQMRQQAYESFTTAVPANPGTVATSSATSSKTNATSTPAQGDNAEASTTPDGHALVPSLAL